ncbi:MAG: ABC transporter substrate binding protein [Bacteroides sp.]
MSGQRYLLLLSILFLSSFYLNALERKANVLFIQSYTNRQSLQNTMVAELLHGLKSVGAEANIITEYLDADYWKYISEKAILRRVCQRAREQQIDLIVTAGDEAFHTLFCCGDSLPRQLPVVFYAIKFPDQALMDSLTNITGYTMIPDYVQILRQASKMFPQRKEVLCITDDSFLGQKGEKLFKKEFEKFAKEQTGYTLRTYNTQLEATNIIISSTCYSRNTNGRLVVIPKWSPFMSVVGKNSKAPFFSCQYQALTSGAFCSYDTDPFDVSRRVGRRVGLLLKGATPQSLKIENMPANFFYDYKQLNFFHVDKKRAVPGSIMNQTVFEKYQFLFFLLYASILALLVLMVVWLMRANHREARRRLHAQTRLMLQNKLVAQRDEFDNVFHSIRDGVITYDVDLRIHFTNRALFKMLHLKQQEAARPFEGMPAESLLKIYNHGREMLREMLKQVVDEGKNIVIPDDSFMQEANSKNYFLVSGEMVPIRAHGKITGVAFSFRNVSDEEMQKRFFSMAIEENTIYPWQFSVQTQLFTFPSSFMKRMGYAECSTLSVKEMLARIHPDDLPQVQKLFTAVINGSEKSNRTSFRQHTISGTYEWWEYRLSIFNGLADEPYSILGVCQNIQRYKSTEEELICARDKALQSDQLKSAFLANMSHEIRTPLNAIVGFSDLLTDMSNFSKEEVGQFVGIINKNCSLLLALINDILDLSRIESGSMDFRWARHSLLLLLKNVCESQRLNMPPGVKLLLSIPTNEKRYLMTDNVRLQQVMNNLINNAAKFTTSGSITLGYIEEKPGTVTLFVEDTGKGISEEGVRHIFERFYKVDNFTQGAGLGLSICQTIVERLKGTISVTSTIGKGTRFQVCIPDTGE